MSAVNQEKSIPVIGVPPPPQPPPVPKDLNIPVVIQNKPKNPKNPPKKGPKKAPQIQNPPKNPGVPKNKRSHWMGPKNESAFITETGLPKSQNGPYVKEHEQKLTAMEQKALSHYLDAHMARMNGKLTEKRKNRHRFKLRMKWLLNKTVMMNFVNKGEIAKELAKEAKLNQMKRAAEKGEIPKEDVIQKVPMAPKQHQKAAPVAPKQPKEQKWTPKTPQTAPQQPKISRKQQQKSVYSLDNRQKFKPTSLMDVQLPPRETYYNDYQSQQTATDYQNGSMGSSARGYQYLNENWINSDEPWRSFQTSSSSSSYPTSSDYNQYQNPTSSDYSQYQNPTSSEYSQYQNPINEPPPPMQSYQLSAPSNIDYSAYPPSQPMISTGYSSAPSLSFSTQPPSYSSFQPQLANTPDFTQAPPTFIPSISEFDIPPGYVSEYRQQFPEPQPQPIQNVPQQFQPTQSYSPFSTAGLPIETALEVSEEELARQKRLLEIEEELRQINAKKIRMQMEDEMRQREYEIVLHEQKIQDRERQIRDREIFMQESRGGERDRRHRYDDRGGSSSFDYYHQNERDDTYYRSSDPRHHHSSSSSSHSNSRQIRIEHDSQDAAAARRHGQPSQQKQQQKRNEKKKLPGEMMKRRGGEGNTSLKRSADTGSHNDVGNKNRAGRIQPAKRPRGPRHRSKTAHEEIPMQAISDDEAGI